MLHPILKSILTIICILETQMIAVIFEFEPNSSKLDTYWDIAKNLATELESVDGFISIERFQSVTNPEKFLSLSIWRDEEAIAKWRTKSSHRKAQSAGRAELFNDYRLRVAGVIRDYGKFNRDQVPSDSKQFHQ